MEHQFHFGKKFYIDKKTGYWISTTEPRIRAHVWVWINTKGEIEKFHHIHHKDGNKSNNDVGNLDKILDKDHYKLHLTDEKREWSRQWANEIRPLTKEWHRSEEGRKWHVEHGIKTWKERKEFEIECLFCKKKLMTKTYHQKYCHQNCKAKYARRVRKGKEYQET